MGSKYDIKRFLITLAIGLFALWYAAGGAYAADYTWDDGSLLDSNWSTPENWSPDGIPGAGDNVIFDSTSNTNCIADVVVDNLASISLNSGYTSTLTLNSDFVGGSNELTLTGNLMVNSGTILCKGDTSTTNGTGIIINAANVTVNSGAKVSADSQGFSASEGPGEGVDGAGAGGGGYGGQGGESAVRGGLTYGSVTQPTALGSGGGNYGASLGGVGGGAIKINATAGTVTIDGTVSAKGGNAPGGRAGGGSGGSIWIIADTLTGTGAITADGGKGHMTWGSGGGGGGRIGLDYNTKTYVGTISATGGQGRSNYGHHGTLSMAFDGNDLTISSNIALAPGTYNIPNLTITNNATLECQADIDGDPVNGSGVIINATDVTVETGAAISASKIGFLSAEGPQSGVNSAGGSGGGHGGKGGASADKGGGLTYGSVTQPTSIGSGGAPDTDTTQFGGAGGGAIKIDATGGTVVIDGTISADGGRGVSGRSGGGAGGSIWIIADTLTGSGVISANGGSCHTTWSNGGGGGGGRIALQYNSNTYTGIIRAAGGYGWPNEGRNGTLSMPFDGNDLIINGSVALAPGNYNIPNLVVTNNATLECQADNDGDPVNGSGVIISATNVTIDSGAEISASKLGFLSAEGPQAGLNGAGGSGAGHGGKGGGSADKSGGLTYGFVTEPTSIGSGGAPDTSGLFGSSGGGAVKINATGGTVTIDGTISANGEKGVSGRSGGGAGGSIWIIADSLEGSGVVSANGGSCHTTYSNGGGGGGGRIVLDYTTMTFTGTISAAGGYGWPNEGCNGTLSMPLDGNDLTINGSVALAPGTYNILNLTIINNATLECQADIDGDPVNGSGVIINATNVTVETGAEISASKLGFISAEGPGAGVNGAGGSGAGHGGAGGDNAGSSGSGGPTYGSVTQPISIGSGGAPDTTGLFGSSGGGAVKINAIGGTVTIDGTISANGEKGVSGRSGGGAGGSIWIVADTLAGSGIISANGGSCHTTYSDGGGGGGGRIRLDVITNHYTGATSVSGGYGWPNHGEAGTLVCSPVGGYTEANVIPQAQCVQSTDGEGMENGIVTISFKVRDPGDEINGVSTLDLAGEIIVNDSEAAFVDGDKSWSSNTAGYGGDQHWAETDAGGSNLATCTWTFNVSEAGNYNVYAWWVRYTNRAKDAPYTIYYNGGLENETVDVNQEGDGSYWYYLGTYYFTGDSSAEKIVLTNDADEYVMADAIRLLPEKYEIIVDDTQATFAPSEGDWTFPLGAGYGGSHYKEKGDGSATCTWAFNVSEAGNYYVYAWWPQGGDRATDTPYTINYNGGWESDTVRVNQQKNGSRWNCLGAYYFTGGGSENIVLSNDATTGTYVMADAIRLVSTTLPYKTDECTLHSFEYSVNGGDWQAPRNGDSSLCLGGGWPDNNGANYPAFNIFADTTEQSFTWDILHYDLSGIFEDHREAENVRIRFKVRNTVPQDDDTYYIDSVSYVLSDSFEIIDPFGLGPAEPIPDSSSDDGGHGGCFIATAAYGSYMEPHVMILRSFRDTHLIPWALGHTFVRTYYKYSPPLAHFISRHEMLKGVVRASLLPLVAVSYAALHFGPVITLTMIVVLLVIPIFIVSFYQLHRHQKKG